MGILLEDRQHSAEVVCKTGVEAGGNTRLAHPALAGILQVSAGLCSDQ